MADIQQPGLKQFPYIFNSMQMAILNSANVCLVHTLKWYLGLTFSHIFIIVEGGELRRKTFSYQLYTMLEWARAAVVILRSFVAYHTDSYTAT